MNKTKILLIALVGILAFVSPAQAADIVSGPLTISYDGTGSVFAESGLAPGQTVSKNLTVQNKGTVAHSFAIATKNVTGDLAQSIYIEPVYAGSKIFSKTIEELSSLSTGSQRIVDSIPAGTTVNVDLAARFDTGGGNALQDQTVSFDIVFGTEESEPVVRTSLLRTRLLATQTATVTSTVTASAEPSITPTLTATSEGQVKGESTENGHGFNPWYLAIIPAGVLLSAVFLPEFAFTAGMAVVAGGATYVLGSESKGVMASKDFIILLVALVAVFLVLCYFFFKHENKVSRRIRGHKHRLRLR